MTTLTSASSEPRILALIGHALRWLDPVPYCLRPTHIQWAAILFVLLCRGPGKLSLDHLVRMRFSAPAER